MARVRVYRAQLRVKTIAIATRIVEQVTYEIQQQATVICLNGPYTTGNLALQMYRRPPIVTGDRVAGRVGNKASYARIAHDGAKIHDIFPKAAPHIYRFGRVRRPALKFFWRRVGRTVYMNQIPGSPSTVGFSHPGYEGKKFLVRPLIAVAARHNMNIVVYDL
jgi:hypothetical protein